MKALVPHSKVKVLSLNMEGTVIEQLKSGEYRVVCGSMTLVRPAKDLEPLAQDPWQKYSHLASKKKYQVDSLEEKPVERIDLHGMRVHEALAHIETFLDKAMMADCGRVEIIHGVGTGALMQAVHEFLKKQSYVTRFHLDEKNTGTTWVYF